MYEEDEFNSETDEALNELLGILGNIPKNVVTMLNVPGYVKAIRSITQIVKFVKVDFPDAEATVEFDGLTGTSLLLTIVTDGVNVYKIKEFCDAVSVASTMDIVPLSDEKVQVGFTYEKIKIAVSPTQ